MKAKILLVDDEKNIRMLIEDCLEAAGYEVFTAVDGEHGIEKFADNSFDLVLLDMLLPGIDGLEVLSRIKSKKPEQLVAMITAHGTIETAVDAMKLGAVDYLQKPFTPEEIRVLVKKILERERMAEVPGENWISCLERAKLKITQRKFDEAIEMLKRTFEFSPEHPEPFNLAGAIYELKKRFSDARKMYRAALAIDPGYKPALDNLHRLTQMNYLEEGLDLGHFETQEPGK
ncbi:sigma-54-dependent transcriptional regulator [Candidatus Formimonas warabiya]|uniref:Stage 0 sporulation protein A homolog n=1 Tax=Formimonas warabiya TaxID=1761012 RepID=A0A3G1KWI0_FORW1|nr:response regulator [Candidatus Formimonas warabiya]ATW26893.1 hypothetical protein DCMF_20905 [Candidatus Formimonas warabiya]